VVFKVAEPALRAALPRFVAPSLNVTVPVAVLGGVAVTVAVRVTCCPEEIVVGFAVTLVLVAALFTVCVKTADVLPA
jgi:hypothetical protein